MSFSIQVLLNKFYLLLKFIERVLYNGSSSETCFFDSRTAKEDPITMLLHVAVFYLF